MRVYFTEALLDSPYRTQEFLPIELDAKFRSAHKIPDDCAPICFRMPDDSMEPVIAAGDWVIIDGTPMEGEGREPVSGGLCCIKILNFTVRKISVHKDSVGVTALNKPKFRSYTTSGPYKRLSPVLAVLPASTSMDFDAKGTLVVNEVEPRDLRR